FFPVFGPAVVQCLTEEYASPYFCDVVQCLTEEYRGPKKSQNSLMARIPDKIKTVDGSKETLKLAMRITDLWFVGVANKSEQAKMVMVDSSGDEIHVVCKQDQLKAWKMDLKENCTYVMHNFRVIKNDGQYKVCDHPYKLAFTGVTIVRQCELDDIIGVVDEIVFCHVSPKSRRVVFKLSDLSDQFLSCTIWDDYCLQFLEYLDEHESESPIIVLLTNARIKEAQGSYPPSVSNSLKASKLANNEPVVQIQEFNQRLSELGIEVRSVLRGRGQGSSQLSGSTQLSSKETFISKSEAKTISEINNICECHKKTDIYTEPFTCACGKHNDRAMLRCRVEVMVNHKDKSTRFLLWDRECNESIGQSADEVNCLKIADGDLNLNASSEALDKFLGNVLAFKIKVQPKYKNSVVLKCSSDLSFINIVLDMLPDVEVLFHEVYFSDYCHIYMLSILMETCLWGLLWRLDL
ncbi:hypothetical protein D0Y65_038428, partial [Glycine soja]